MEKDDTIKALRATFSDISMETVLTHQMIASRLKINLTDHKCLGLLMHHKQLNAGSLAELTGLTSGAITSAIDRLVRLGYAKRVRTEQDRRQVLVVPTISAQLRTELNAIYGPIAIDMETMLQTYSQADLQKILVFLEKLVSISRSHRQKIAE